MKKMKTMLIFLLLGMTWLLLFFLTGNKTPWGMSDGEKAEGETIISLGDVAGRNYDRMGFDGGEILYSPVNRGWIVGTIKGEMYHFSIEGYERWSRTIGIGEIRSLALSKDNRIVYVGESSPSGTLYALEVATGDILWKFDGVDVIGVENEIRAYPIPIHVETDKEGNVYAIFYRSTVSKNHSRAYISRIISFDERGNERWRYPLNENMDSWINWGSVSFATGRFAFASANYDKSGPEERKYNKNIYVLDKDKGTLISAKDIPAAPLFEITTIRNGPNYSEDGEYLSAMTSDGRGILFDENGSILWQRVLSKPHKVAGGWYNAAGRDAYIVPEGVVFTTINTFNRANWQIPAPIIHPSSNSVYLFDMEGAYKFKYTAGAEVEGITFSSSGIAAIAIGRNVRNHDYGAHGAAVISLVNGKELNRYHTKGPIQAISISDDGKYAAGIEVPAVTPDGDLIGSYDLHIWNRENDND